MEAWVSDCNEEQFTNPWQLAANLLMAAKVYE
jgi:hypothetical protein